MLRKYFRCYRPSLNSKSFFSWRSCWTFKNWFFWSISKWAHSKSRSLFWNRFQVGFYFAENSTLHVIIFVFFINWFLIHVLDHIQISTNNPYRQIPETISKKRAVTQGISRKLFPDFFQILQFWGVTQGIFRKLFPGKFHEYLPMKKDFDSKSSDNAFLIIISILLSEKK